MHMLAECRLALFQYVYSTIYAWLEADTHSASPQTHVWSSLCNKRNEALTKMPVLKLCFCLSKRIANLSKTAVYIDEMLCILCQQYVWQFLHWGAWRLQSRKGMGSIFVLLVLDSIFQLIRLISFLNKKREIPFFCVNIIMKYIEKNICN